MSLPTFPTKPVAKWSVRFLFAFLAAFVLSQVVFMFRVNNPGGEDFVQFRPLLIAISLVVMASGLGAFVTAVYSLIKEKEKSALLYVSLLLGAFVIIFLLGEVLFPH